MVVYCPAGQTVRNALTFVQCDPGICPKIDTVSMGFQLLSSCTAAASTEGFYSHRPLRNPSSPPLSLIYI